MKRILLLAFAALWLAAPAPSQAQSVTKLCFPATGLTATRTSCIPVDSTNPLPTTATLSAAGGVNVTVTNTTGTPAVVTCTNCGAASVTGPFNVTVTNTVATAAVVTCANCATASVSGTLTVQNLSAGSNLNVLDTNSAAILAGITSAIPAGTNAIGTVTVQNVNSGSPVFVQQVPGTTQGWTPVVVSSLSTTVTTVKSTTGKLAKLYCYSPNAAVTYVQVFNATPSSVTLGSTTPLASYGIPATNAAGFSQALGDVFSSAISVAATTTVKGATAPNTAIDCTVSYN